MKRPVDCPHPCLSVYFEVADIEETLEKVQAAGGKTVVPKTAIPGAGHFAMFSDADGITAGLYQGK
jgi:predicted enzyme related to lactoylglutathione lyase